MLHRTLENETAEPATTTLLQRLLSIADLPLILLATVGAIAVVGTFLALITDKWGAVEAIATTVGALVGSVGLFAILGTLQAQERQLEIGREQLQHSQRRELPVFLGSRIETHLMEYGLRNVFNVHLRNDGGIAYAVRVHLEDCTSDIASRHAAPWLPGNRENVTLEPGGTLEGTLYGPARSDEERERILSLNNDTERSLGAKFQGKNAASPVQLWDHLDLRLEIEYIDFRLVRSRQRFRVTVGYWPGPVAYGVTKEAAIALSLVYLDTVPNNELT